MLIPRFSLRWLFVLTGVCALFFVVLAAGWRGEYWAGGVAIAVLFLIVTLIIHAAVFWLAWLLYQMLGRSLSDRQRDPLRTAELIPTAGLIESANPAQGDRQP
ncbi:MAG: hypothetical protein OES79_08105 [Planctomycetota bacterium]|nr:hypothetical protein [Planctomycetota bacterium]